MAVIKKLKAVKKAENHLLGIQELSFSKISEILKQAETFITLNRSSTKKLESVNKAINAAPKTGDKSIKAKSSDASPKQEGTDFDYSEDLDALVSDEATLSEGFRAKAEAIFELTSSSTLPSQLRSIISNCCVL